MPVTIDGTTGLSGPARSVSGPAFSVYASANQTLTTNVPLKMALNVEELDSANCFDSTTNYRFTPNVAGWYQIQGSATSSASTSMVNTWTNIYKNGTALKRGVQLASSGFAALNSSVSSLVYLNGTTDYVELFHTVSGTGTLTTVAGADTVYMSGFLVRAA